MKCRVMHRACGVAICYPTGLHRDLQHPDPFVARKQSGLTAFNQFGEVFNLLNIADLTGYSSVLNQPNYGQPSARAGQAFGTGGPRAFQAAARMGF